MHGALTSAVAEQAMALSRSTGVIREKKTYAIWSADSGYHHRFFESFESATITCFRNIFSYVLKKGVTAGSC